MKDAAAEGRLCSIPGHARRHSMVGSSRLFGVSFPASLLTRRLPFELAHALMIEQPRLTIRRDESRDPGTHNERLGMVHLEAIAIHQGDSEWPKGSLSLECLQGPLEI